MSKILDKIKQIVYKVMPDNVISFMSKQKAEIKNARFHNKTNKEIFSVIYKEKVWGKSDEKERRFYSGTGSDENKIVDMYVKKVSEFLSTFDEKPSVVDLGCGDFYVGSKLRKLCGRYIACDVVPALLEYNKKKYADLNVDFQLVDIACDPIPRGKIIFIRQVFQHLSNEQILKALQGITKSCEYMIVTEHGPEMSEYIPNIDKKTGSHIRLEWGSGIDLLASPFELKVKESYCLCEVKERKGVLRTYVYKLL